MPCHLDKFDCHTALMDWSNELVKRINRQFYEKIALCLTREEFNWKKRAAIGSLSFSSSFNLFFWGLKLENRLAANSMWAWHKEIYFSMFCNYPLLIRLSMMRCKLSNKIVASQCRPLNLQSDKLAIIIRQTPWHAYCTNALLCSVTDNAKRLEIHDHPLVIKTKKESQFLSLSRPVQIVGQGS